MLVFAYMSLCIIILHSRFLTFRNRGTENLFSAIAGVITSRYYNTHETFLSTFERPIKFFFFFFFKVLDIAYEA